MGTRRTFAPDGSGPGGSSTAHLEPEKRAIIAEALALAGRKLQEGALVQAMHMASEVLKRVPGHPEALAIQGNVAFLQCNYPAAIDFYRRSVAANGQVAQVHFNLGVTLEKVHRHAEAAESFTRVVALDPHFPNGWMALGVARTGEWSFKEAIEITVKALDYPCDRAEALATLGGAHLGLGQAREALLRYAEAARLKPDAQHLHGAMNVAAAVLALSAEAGVDEVWTSTLAQLRETMPASPMPAFVEAFVEKMHDIQSTEALDRARAALPRAEEQAIALSHTISGRRGPSAERAPARMCILLNFGRSGSGLVHALLDDHPQVTTLPGVYFKGFFGPGTWERIRNADPETMIGQFMDAYPVLFDARDPRPVPGNPTSAENGVGLQEGFTHMGDDGKQWLAIDRSAFRAQMREQLAGRSSVSQGDFFLMAHRAFERARGRSDEQELLFYHIHNPTPYELENYLRQFPETQVLMMVREPVQSCESWNTKYVQEQGNYVGFATRMGFMPFHVDEAAFGNRDAFGLRLEDLKRRPEASMRALAARLGIDWHPRLLEPTMQGLKWWGDPTSKTFGLDPFDTGVIEREVGEIFGARDQQILRTLYYPFRVLYGYQEPDAAGFQADLEQIESMLDEPMACERTLIKNAGLPPEKLPHHTSYKYLRVVFRSRLETLKKHGTYPGMIEPLVVEG
ncbi:MAG: sulfotransferase [Alphaproteobacteria bacterium]|nr:sulfotransferase [Alphaproteobacteria bacterium]